MNGIFNEHKSIFPKAMALNPADYTEAVFDHPCRALVQRDGESTLIRVYKLIESAEGESADEDQYELQCIYRVPMRQASTVKNWQLYLATLIPVVVLAILFFLTREPAMMWTLMIWSAFMLGIKAQPFVHQLNTRMVMRALGG